MLDGGREDYKAVSRVCVLLCMRIVKLSECMLVFFKISHVMWPCFALLSFTLMVKRSNFYLTYDTYLMIEICVNFSKLQDIAEYVGPLKHVTMGS